MVLVVALLPCLLGPLCFALQAGFKRDLGEWHGGLVHTGEYPDSFKLEKSRMGIFYGLTAGMLSAAGSLGFFAAFRSGGNASVITTSTGMYPVVTVLVALTFLRERLTWVQVVGLGFATVAFFIFSH
jgi:uncharacterized membrane protein